MRWVDNLYAKVIVNPAAGAGSTRRKWSRLSQRLREVGLSFDCEFTEATGHAIELARRAVRGGYRYLVAVGGDGTLNEVANGILRSTDSRNILLGMISTGTGNSFVRSVGIPRDYLRACSLLTNPRRLLIDVGVVKYKSGGQSLERFFVNVAGAGFDAAILQGAKRLPQCFGGYLPYLAGFPESLFRYKNKLVTLSVGGRVESGRILTVMVANGGYCDGGMLIAPQAKPGDGFLDVVIIGDIGKLGVLKLWPRVYRGAHLRHPKVKTEKVTHIALESSERLRVQTDGEVLGECPASFRLVPAALSIA